MAQEKRHYFEPNFIDDLKDIQTETDTGKWVILAPLEMFGPYKWLIRFYHAALIVRGKARAVRFHA